MTPHSIFLRVGCSLPSRLRQAQEQFDKGWMLAGEATASTLDARIRDAGWHFLWIVGSFSRWGFGQTESAATHSALGHALRQIKGCYNAAELGSVRIRKCPGFRAAKVTLHPRHIREQAFPGVTDAKLRFPYVPL